MPVDDSGLVEVLVGVQGEVEPLGGGWEVTKAGFVPDVGVEVDGVAGGAELSACH